VGHVLKNDPPKACAGCKHRGWQDVPGAVRIGRPPKKATKTK
jgi:hypothetical protein